MCVYVCCELGKFVLVFLVYVGCDSGEIRIVVFKVGYLLLECDLDWLMVWW